MPTYVLDTSVVLQWFNQSGELHIKQARQILLDLKSGKINILVPDILALELLNVFIKAKFSTIEEAKNALKNLFEFPIKTVGISLPVLEESSIIMREYNMASYDAYFLALAQYEDCKLISDDQKAHGQVKDGTVIMLGQYTPRMLV